MNASTLVETIREDTNCLWAIIARLRHMQGEETDVTDGEECYARLKELRAAYYERRLDILDSSYLWFLDQVVDAFEDIYERYVAQSN